MGLLVFSIKNGSCAAQEMFVLQESRIRRVAEVVLGGVSSACVRML